ELILMAHAIDGITVDATACPGSGEARAHFDGGTLALMGHSMGATIAPLVLAFEPRYRAVILSGAGGSWIENIMHKREPVYIRPIAEILLDYNMDARSLTDGDPALTLFQWAAEAADPQV